MINITRNAEGRRSSGLSPAPKHPNPTPPITSSPPAQTSTRSMKKLYMHAISPTKATDAISVDTAPHNPLVTTFFNSSPYRPGTLKSKIPVQEPLN